jgi:hypothetical protein
VNTGDLNKLYLLCMHMDTYSTAISDIIHSACAPVPTAHPSEEEDSE